MCSVSVLSDCVSNMSKLGMCGVCEYEVCVCVSSVCVCVTVCSCSSKK